MGGWDLGIFHPPCTYLAVCGARYFAGRQNEQKAAIEFFLKLANAPIGFICLENPVSVISTAYRKPDQVIQPYQFGHGEMKRTCLWLKNLPKLIPTSIVPGRDQKILLHPDSKNRKKDRSRSYPGIGEAMATQWGKFVTNSLFCKSSSVILSSGLMENNIKEINMENATNGLTTETNPVEAPKFKTFRPGSLCALAQTIINKMEGEFSIKDVVNTYTEECLKIGEDPKTALRNCRLVVYTMMSEGRLVKVSRGRWKRS
jgi:hypothetical protein